MNRIITFSLTTLPKLVSLGKLSAEDKSAVKKKLLSGHPGVMSAFETAMHQHAGFVTQSNALASYDELCETLRCCLEIDVERRLEQSATVVHPAVAHQTIQDNLRTSVFGATSHTAGVTLLFAAPEMVHVAQEAANNSNGYLVLGKINWGRFDTANGWPNLYIENAHHLQFNDVMFLASFHSPDVVFEQLSAIYAIGRYACKSLKVVIPFFPTGTMERIERVGEVATAATLARIISVAPHTAYGPTQLVFLDIHALQEQFYFTDQVLVHLKSCIHLLKVRLAQLREEDPKVPIAIVFPDDGAHKRFKTRFKGYNMVICHKIRDGDSRKVVIRDGAEFVKGAHCVLVDDLVKSGGTLIECGKAVSSMGCKHVSAYVTHGCFPRESWKKFVWSNQNATENDVADPVVERLVTRRNRSTSLAEMEYWQFLGGRSVQPMERITIDRSKSQVDLLTLEREVEQAKSSSKVVFSYFWITNSIPTTAKAVKGIKPFQVLSIAPLMTYLRRSFYTEDPTYD